LANHTRKIQKRQFNRNAKLDNKRQLKTNEGSIIYPNALWSWISTSPFDSKKSSLLIFLHKKKTLLDKLFCKIKINGDSCKVLRMSFYLNSFKSCLF
jgi:hypothetical protein